MKAIAAFSLVAAVTMALGQMDNGDGQGETAIDNRTAKVTETEVALSMNIRQVTTEFVNGRPVTQTATDFESWRPTPEKETASNPYSTIASLWPIDHVKQMLTPAKEFKTSSSESKDEKKNATSSDPKLPLYPLWADTIYK